MIEAMLASLADNNEKPEGFDLDDLRAVLNEEGAVESIMTLAPREETSVQQGEKARDFTLPFLQPEDGAATHLTLSSHFGRRPVGLIFGSFT